MGDRGDDFSEIFRKFVKFILGAWAKGREVVFFGGGTVGGGTWFGGGEEVCCCCDIGFEFGVSFTFPSGSWVFDFA
jgi:hypothetical protein